MRSWVEGANESDLNHLPYGAFRKEDSARLCVRIGPSLLDIAACEKDGLLDSLTVDVREACCQPSLNALLSLGPEAWHALRHRLRELLEDTAPGDIQTRVDWFLYPLREAQVVLPVDAGGYTDFMRACITRGVWGSCSGRTIRCCRTTSMCRSHTTVVRRRWW